MNRFKQKWHRIANINCVSMNYKVLVKFWSYTDQFPNSALRQDLTYVQVNKCKNKVKTGTFVRDQFIEEQRTSKHKELKNTNFQV